MKKQSILFLLGILLLQQFKHLPPSYWIPVLLLFLGAGVYFFRQLLIPSFFAIGFIFALFYAHHELDWTLPSSLEGKTVQVSGLIESLPFCSQQQCSFLFYLQTINTKPVNHVVKLNWRRFDEQHNKKIKAGEEWSLSVKLKKIHGYFNPGGFDYEAWAFQEGIRASGYVIDKNKNILLSDHWFHSPLNRIRAYFQLKIEQALPVTNTSPWITALVLGERHGISSENWEVLRKTGTNHLMAIAGLHIGLMAFFIHALISFLGRRITALTLLVPIELLASLGALGMALLYSALAGFTIPTQRACLMLTVFLMTVLLRRKIAAWQSISVALFFMLLINPLDVLSDSFWLSFGSVSLIIYGMSGRLFVNNLWWKWGRIQWVIAVGLVPLSIAFFHQFSWVGFVANSISIPCVGLVIVPLCLLGSFTLIFSSQVGSFILILADKLLSWVWWILSYLAHLPWSVWHQVMPNTFYLIISCLGVMILLLPIGTPGRWFGLMGLLPLIFYQPAAPKQGELWFTLLDVGQGLSSVIHTQHHVLVFDAGSKLGDSFDMGESVVLPFLEKQGIKKIDRLVISHGDNDHIGGSNALLTRFPVSVINTSVPDQFTSFYAITCLKGLSWSWDGVQFEFIYPTLLTLNLNNDSSCVLRVRTGERQILLLGDIEKAAENYLIQNAGDKLRSDLIVAPHHGSRTSAVPGFLSAVKPQYVLYAVGYRNRYHFPNKQVMNQYAKLGTLQLDTVLNGAMQFDMNSEKLTFVSAFRKQERKYWND